MDQIIYKLVMQKGPSPGKEFILDRPQVIVGRDIQNEVVINDAEMSRHHAKLVFEDEAFVVQDMGSTNGVFVNEQRVSGSMTLADGALIRMGDNVVLKYLVVVPDFDRTLASKPRQAAPEKPTPPPQPVPQQQVVAEQPDQFALPSKQPSAGGASAAPDKPPQRSMPIQRPKPVPAKGQGYAGRVPESPPSQQLELPFDMRMLSIGCGSILVVIAIILIIALIYIDNNYLWCDWLGWLLPGRCPIG